jgi:hypothetical protein
MAQDQQPDVLGRIPRSRSTIRSTARRASVYISDQIMTTSLCAPTHCRRQTRSSGTQAPNPGPETPQAR